MWQKIYLHPRLFIYLSVVFAAYLFSFAWVWLKIYIDFTLIALSFFVMADFMLLFFSKKTQLFAQRITANKYSNGFDNEVFLEVTNHFPFNVHLMLIDEVPTIFQLRDFHYSFLLKRNETKKLKYVLRPTKRGIYVFGALNIYVASPLQLFRLKWVFMKEPKQEVAVYPSFAQMKQYEFLAAHHQLSTVGIKKIRKLGYNKIFDQLKEYVQGDDIRSINWKATARRSQLMVNHYEDERSQPMYCLIDKGRTMQMPFLGMSLLDYAINASLVLSNVAIQKQDKAGLITFNHKISVSLPALQSYKQMQKIVEALYAQKTAYKESDYEMLYTHLKRNLNHRSLLVLFTNFESHSSLLRQIDYLKLIAKQHVLVVVFFENTEVKEVLENTANNQLDKVYLSITAEKLDYEKRLIVRELRKYGIFAVLAKPEEITVKTINQYLLLKAQGLF